MGAPMSPLIAFKNLSKSYMGDNVFNDLNFELDQGECCLLQGENGCGKSTLLKIVSGLIVADSGVMALGSANFVAINCSTRALRKLSVYMHQQPYLFDKSVADNLSMVLADKTQLSSDFAGQKIQAMQLDGILSENAMRLSVGQKQRVALVRSLLAKPDLLLLDEPFTALDKQAYQVAIELISQYKQSQGTVLLTSHQHNPDFTMVDRFWRMDSGALN